MSSCHTPGGRFAMRLDEIHTLWRRELKKAFADKATLLVSAVWPLLLIFLLGIGFDSFVELKGIGISYTEFMGPGIIALMAMGGAVYVGNEMIKDKEGFIKELLVAPISRVSIFVGKILGAMTLSFSIMTIVVVAFLEAIGKLSLASVLWALLFMFLIAFIFYSLSMALAFPFRRSSTYQQIASIIWFAVSFLSGAFFPIKSLPIWMKAVAYANPLTYGIDGLRGQMVGEAAFPVATNLLVLVAFAVFSTILGAALYRKSISA